MRVRPHSRIGAIAIAVVAALVAGACTGNDEPDEEPTSLASDEVVENYRSMPADLCNAVDIAAPEPLLGPVDEFGPEVAEGEERISVSGGAHCQIYYNDGVNETWVSISIEMRRAEPIGKASEQDPDHEFGYFWAYTRDSANDNLEAVPEPEALQVESSWESAQVLNFIEVADDRLTWDPEGHGTALVGTFTDRNVAATVSITKEGFEETEVPDPEPYAEVITGFSEELFEQLGTDDGYEPDE